MKLGSYDKSEAQLLKTEDQRPGLYETHSNLGVLYKKTGDYEKSATHLKKALLRKPLGHLGLGDYYLKMILYQAKIKKEPDTPPSHDFLGQAYDRANSTPRLKESELIKLQALVRSDRKFPDALLVLGDELMARAYPDLALLSYVRARQLGHPRVDLIQKRIRSTKSIGTAWKKLFTNQPGGITVYRRPSVRRAEKDMKEGGRWVLRFMQVESELIQGDLLPDFQTVEKELKKRGVSRFHPKYRGVTTFSFERIFSRPRQNQP